MDKYTYEEVIDICRIIVTKYRILKRENDLPWVLKVIFIEKRACALTIDNGYKLSLTLPLVQEYLPGLSNNDLLYNLRKYEINMRY